MKIKKLTTLSFSISEKAESKIERKLRIGRGNMLGFMGPNEGVKVRKGYLPLARFRASRRERTKKGFETRKNYFYIDLSNGEIYYIRKNKIKRYDLPKRLLGLSREAITELGNLLRFGSRFRDELDQDVVLELSDMGLVDIYKLKSKQLMALLIDELSADPTGRVTQTKEHIKAAYPLPRFTDRGYDLSAFLELDDRIVESYQKDAIKYSTDRMGKILKYLFNAEITLEGMTFMPYLKADYRGRDKYRIKSSDIHFPVCFIGDKRVKKKKGIQLKPIALSVEIGTKDTVPMETPTIDFSDVIGLGEVKKEIEDSIIRPIREPELARKFGKRGGGAILLYGPPGCGKSYIAKATIGECGVPFFNVNISDIVAMGADEGAKSLHKIFDEANRNSPSIIFFDEIDAIGGRRDSGQKHLEKMGVTQLLMEMDGAQGLMENVLIIAATNAPWAIDPALRRSGRFTKQIFVPSPDLKAREEIFRIHTRDKPIAKDIDFKKLAELTEGYSCSDIKAICDKVIQILWDETLSGGERDIGMDDFLRVIKEHRSSLIPWFRLAEREIKKSGEVDLYEEFSGYILRYAGGVDRVQKPEIKFSDVGGMEAVKEEIRKFVVYPIERPELAEKFGRDTGGAVLLYGPPGCGKTYIARALAGECNASFFNVNITDILSQDAGESERNIRDIFERAERNAPSVLFFDEFDAIAGRRDHINGGIEKRIVNQFLMEMDGFMEKRDIMVIAATNAPWAIDPALRRSGRFTKQIFVPSPDLKAREEIFRIHTRDKPIAKDIDFKKLAELTEGYSCSDIKAICDFAAEIPWNEAISDGREREIRTEDFLWAIKERTPSILPWFGMAKKQILESGEKDVYGELFKFIEEYEKEFQEGNEREDKIEIIPPDEKEKEEIRKLVEERKRLEEKMDLARIRYNEGVINKEDFELIMMHYQMELIGIEVRIKQLSDPTADDEYREPETILEKKYNGTTWMKDMQNPLRRVHYRIRLVREDIYEAY